MKEDNCPFGFMLGLLVATVILVGFDQCATAVSVKEYEIAIQNYLMYPEKFTVKKVYEDTILVGYKVTYNGNNK